MAKKICEVCWILQYEGKKKVRIHSSMRVPPQYLVPYDGVEMRLKFAKFCPNCGRKLK